MPTQFTRAGHPPPLLVRQGHVRSLRRGGPIVGIQDMVWQQEALRLRPRDRLLMVSDGLLEAMGEGGQRFEHRRLESIATATAHLPIPDALQKIHDTVRSFTASADFADDVSLFAVDVE